jgi:hypothetical protein
MCPGLVPTLVRKLHCQCMQTSLSKVYNLNSYVYSILVCSRPTALVHVLCCCRCLNKQSCNCYSMPLFTTFSLLVPSFGKLCLLLLCIQVDFVDNYLHKVRVIKFLGMLLVTVSEC